MEHNLRHRILWTVMYPLVAVFVWLRLGYRAPRVKLPRPCLFVSNHCTDFDPLMAQQLLRKQTYFIASDHIFRKPLTAKLLLWAAAPITRVKGTTAGDTALTAIRRMRKGASVALFAEGNRSFNGHTGAIVESTAKLARMSGASLVTHRFRGGYLSSPRWAGAKTRRGRLTSEIVHIYTPEELKAMKPAEIAAHIREDIAEDAFATQRDWIAPYRGRRLAEYLERALCLCPRCGAMSTLASEGNDFFCTACGMKTRYTKYGFFQGGDLPFDNVYDWDVWQSRQLQARAESAGEDPIAQDGGITLTEVLEDHTTRVIATGGLAIYRDRLECCGMCFPLAELGGMALPGPQGLELEYGGSHYSLSCKTVCNTRKYFTIWKALTAPEEILAV